MSLVVGSSQSIFCYTVIGSCIVHVRHSILRYMYANFTFILCIPFVFEMSKVFPSTINLYFISSSDFNNVQLRMK